MKKLKKVLLSSLSLLSLISCSSNIIDVIKSPAEDGGLEGNAASDTVTKADSKALKTLLECNWKVKESILMLQCDLTYDEAREALRKNCGVLRRTLASLSKN